MRGIGYSPGGCWDRCWFFFLSCFHHIRGDSPDRPTVADTVVGESVSPFMRWTHSAASGVRDFFARIFGIRDIDREYEELKKRVAQLELEKEWAQELIDENKRLTALMGFTRQDPQYLYMNAEVIARSRAVFDADHQPRRKDGSPSICRSYGRRTATDY